MTNDGKKKGGKARKAVKHADSQLNFNVLGCHSHKNPSPKAPLYVFEKSFTGEVMIEVCKKQLKPFLKKNPNIKRVVMDGAPQHPGNGIRQSKAACKWWNEDPVCSKLELLAGPNEWENDGKLRKQPTLSQFRNRAKVGPPTTKGHTWIADSPDANTWSPGSSIPIRSRPATTRSPS